MVLYSLGAGEETVPRVLQSPQGLSDSQPGCFLVTWPGGWNTSWPLLRSPSRDWGVRVPSLPSGRQGRPRTLESLGGQEGAGYSPLPPVSSRACGGVKLVGAEAIRSCLSICCEQV